MTGNYDLGSDDMGSAEFFSRHTGNQRLADWVAQNCPGPMTAVLRALRDTATLGDFAFILTRPGVMQLLDLVSAVVLVLAECDSSRKTTLAATIKQGGELEYLERESRLLDTGTCRSLNDALWHAVVEAENHLVAQGSYDATGMPVSARLDNCKSILARAGDAWFGRPEDPIHAAARLSATAYKSVRREARLAGLVLSDTALATLAAGVLQAYHPPERREHVYGGPR